MKNGGSYFIRTVMNQERNRWEIIRDILKATIDDNKVKKTRILQKAYLDWRTFSRYFDFLNDEGFITKYKPNGSNEECYMITDKGKAFINKLKELEDVMA